ncbi:phage baseplate assembly protein V [Nevskia ramosa]|uniref:phage baseplate assembly protein V n=1 Tax=Nevskia ramosa TaxID=64002 RepID=UPI002352EC67|nr:phage baseplate assembly protein V [Nevskia ramosa]
MSRNGLLAAIQTAQRPLLRRLRALASRASIARVDDGAKLQQVQISVMAGERLDGVQRLQYFGHSAVPPAGSTCLLVSIAGSRTHCIVIGGEHESRPRDLAEGESQIYNSEGDHVWLKSDGEIAIKASLKVTIDSPLVHCTGELTAAGRIYSATAVQDPLGTMQEMRVTYNGHNHGGVQIGSGNTATTLATMT